MPDRSVFSWSNIGASLLAGVASAAVFAVLTTHSLPGLLLAHLASLPILIIALGFGVSHGATAALVGTVVLSLWPQKLPATMEEWQFGMAFGLLVALPAWLAAYAASGAPYGGRDRLTKHLPSWACLAVAGALTIVVGLGVIIATITEGGLDAALTEYKARAFMIFDEVFKEQPGEVHPDPAVLATYVVQTLPGTLAAHLAMTHSLNLWCAAWLVRLSIGPKAAPAPDVAMEYVLPRAVVGVFVLGVGLSFAPGPIAGPLGLVIASTSGLLLAFQGLAVAHARLRGSKSSTLVLSIIYFTIGLLGFPIVLLALLGAADVFFDYRKPKPIASQTDA